MYRSQWFKYLSDTIHLGPNPSSSNTSVIFCGIINYKDLLAKWNTLWIITQTIWSHTISNKQNKLLWKQNLSLTNKCI